MKIHLTVYLLGLTAIPKADAPLAQLPIFRMNQFVVEPRQEDPKPIWGRTKAQYVAKTVVDTGETRLLNPPIVYETVDALVTTFRLFNRGYVTAFPAIGESRLSPTKTSCTNSRLARPCTPLREEWFTD